MASIKTYINQIKNAIYGKDVRSSIVDAIEKVNSDNEAYQSLADNATTALKQANAIVAGKVGIDDTNVGLGTTYSSKKITDTLNDSLSPLTGKIISTANTDLNDYKTTGIYYFSSSYTPLNIPIGVNGWLQVFRTSDTTVKQIWYRFGTANSNDSNTYVRTLVGTTWSDWTQFITQRELDSQFNVSGAANNTGYVSLPGGLKICWGTVNIVPTAANTATAGAITFPISFDYAPNIQVTGYSGLPHTISVSASGITKTGATIYLTRSDTTNTGIMWKAIGK